MLPNCINCLPRRDRRPKPVPAAWAPWRLTLAVGLVLALCPGVRAQQLPPPEVNLLMQFRDDQTKSHALFFHIFSPVRAQITGYKKDGTRVQLNATDSLKLLGVVVGTYGGYSGEWLQTISQDGGDGGDKYLYVPLRDLRDVSSEMKPPARSFFDEYVYYLEPQNRRSLYRLGIVLLAALPVGLLGLFVRKVRPARVGLRWPWQAAAGA